MREYPDRPWVGIGVVLFRGEEVLLIQRGRPPRQGQWSLPGGAQSLGETAEAAARRELLEEAAVTAGPLVLTEVIDAVSRDAEGRVRFHYTIVDYAGRWAGGVVQAGDDAMAAAWVHREALAAQNLTAETLAVIALAWRRLAEAGL